MSLVDIFVFIRKDNLDSAEQVRKVVEEVYADKLNEADRKKLHYLSELGSLESETSINIPEPVRPAFEINLRPFGRSFESFDMYSGLKDYACILFRFYSEQEDSEDLFERLAKTDVDSVIITSGDFKDGFDKARFLTPQAYIETYLFMAYEVKKDQYKILSEDKLVQLMKETLQEMAGKYNYSYSSDKEAFSLATINKSREIKDKELYNKLHEEFGSIHNYIIQKALKKGIVERNTE